MIRSYENPYAWPAGAMSLFVHALLLTLLLASFNWKTTQPMSVAQVELWDILPVTKPVAKVKPVVVKPQPPEPPKPVVEEKPEPKPEPANKADIQIKKEVEKPKEKVVKPEKPLEKAKDEPKPKVDDKKQKEEALKKLQQELLAEDAKPVLYESKKQEGKPDAALSAAAAQATANELNAAIAGIRNKIRQNVNNQPCGADDIELTYKIVVIPTGEIASINLVKSSKIPACDEAVERAIHSSEPLPMPKDPNLISQFRNLILPFRPNGKN
jgi:colicin import membrane protein